MFIQRDNERHICVFQRGQVMFTVTLLSINRPYQPLNLQYKKRKHLQKHVLNVKFFPDPFRSVPYDSRRHYRVRLTYGQDAGELPGNATLVWEWH